ncbi:hypothetical protein D3C78_364450 [compost metagenome]
MLGGPGEQHEQQQGTGQEQVDVAHHPHTFLHPRDRYGHRSAHHQDDERDLHPLAMADAEQVVEAGIEVQHPEAHVGAQAEHRGDDAETVYRVTDRPVDTLADQRVQRRTQSQRQVVAVGEVGQRHADEGKHAPAMQAPVQEQYLHRLAPGLRRARLTLGGLEHVGQGFGNAEEEQRDADTGGEQHAGPRQVAELGFVVVGTELDLAVAGQGGDHHEDQVQGHGQHVVPADRVGRPVLRCQEPVARCLRLGDDHQAEDEDEACRKIEHRRVHADLAVGRGRCTHGACTSSIDVRFGMNGFSKGILLLNTGSGPAFFR